jgi:hypothetical protein
MGNARRSLAAHHKAAAPIRPAEGYLAFRNPMKARGQVFSIAYSDNSASKFRLLLTHTTTSQHFGEKFFASYMYRFGSIRTVVAL